MHDPEYLRRTKSPDDPDMQEQQWGPLIVEAPNGTKWKIDVDNNGNLTTEQVTE
jgi:hypothetical protein